MDKSPKAGEYDEKRYPKKHVYLVNDRLSCFSANEVSKCKLLALTMVILAKLWSIGIPDERIESWDDFYERFFAHFIARKRQSVIVDALRGSFKGITRPYGFILTIARKLLLRWKEHKKTLSFGSLTMASYTIIPSS